LRGLVRGEVFSQSDTAYLLIHMLSVAADQNDVALTPPGDEGERLFTGGAFAVLVVIPHVADRYLLQRK
jgi:hypothetical protein